MSKRETAERFKPVHDISGIQSAYSGRAAAQNYVHQRFDAELNRLLNDRQVTVLERVMKLTRPARTLEIAPGPGRITRSVKSAGVLVCLEYNEGMIEQGRSACDGKPIWVRGNGFQLPFRQMFDLVYSFRFVRHFCREDRKRLYAQIKTVLKPGGVFLMDAVNAKISRPLRDGRQEEYPIYDKLYSPDELQNELTEAGLSPIEFFPVQRCFRWQYRSQVLLGPRANWVNRLVIRWLERLSRADGLEWIVTCRYG